MELHRVLCTPNLNRHTRHVQLGSGRCTDAHMALPWEQTASPGWTARYIQKSYKAFLHMLTHLGMTNVGMSVTTL